ncbi:hypothetical protein HZB93_04240 [Candidatus Falkowbacteria bacterium]|nr:hypothetical protein [Candidatus Falkowbacteria bacterium]
MRLFAALFVMFAMSGCFTAQTSLRSGGMTYEANGFMGPGPMEMSAADLTSAQADRIRDEGSCLRSQGERRGGHPERCYRGYSGGYGYGGSSNYYGYGQYGYGQTRDPALEERAEDLEEDADDYDRRLDALEGRQP